MNFNIGDIREFLSLIEALRQIIGGLFVILIVICLSLYFLMGNKKLYIKKKRPNVRRVFYLKCRRDLYSFSNCG